MATHPRTDSGTAKSSDPQKDDQFTSPAIDTPASAATISQEHHFRIASAATTDGVASKSPRPTSGHTPRTSTIESSHPKEDPLSPIFAHDIEMSAIDHVVATHTVIVNAARAAAHHTVRDTSAA
ncbi:hypothetical protein GS506_28985 [Rhodococcus hoagii]|nr:hypothetical protein [Prescottella equi]